MQRLVLLLALGAILVESVPVGPAPPGHQEFIPITKQENAVGIDGSFKNSFETGNGIAVDETGYTKDGGPAGPIQVIQGSNGYTAPDGQVIQTQYTADERGYLPSGSHLPTPPPVDPIILKSLEYLASLPSTPEPEQQPSKYYQPQSVKYQQ